MSEQFSKYTTEDLSEKESTRLLRKFARFRSLIILPFGFLRNVNVTERRIINCLRRTSRKWQIDEQAKMYRGIPLSAYRKFGRDYASRMKHVPDTEGYETKTYVVPGTERESLCDKCNGRGSTECNSCRGTGLTECLECNGTGYETEKPLCPVCDGDGRIPLSKTITMPNRYDSEYEIKVEEEAICPNCKGTGYERERILRCYYCSGKGQIDCTACRGSGKVKCRGCEGNGKTYAARIVEVTHTPISSLKTEMSFPSSLPKNYLIRTLGTVVSQEIAQVSANSVEKREIRKIPVKMVLYKIRDKTYSLYEINGKLKSDKYPVSIIKTLVFLVCLAVLSFLLTISIRALN